MVATRAGAGAASGGAGSAATHTGPSTHRGPAGLDQDTYAPQAKAAAAAAPGPNAPAAGPPASGSSSARSFGQGVPRPRRKDLERQAYIELDVDGVQKEQMKRAHKAYGSPSARSDACKWQQTNEEYHPITPLSPLLPPLPHKPHERCNCSFSFNQQFGQIGLGSPSVSRQFTERQKPAYQARQAARRAAGAEKKARKLDAKQAEQAERGSRGSRSKRVKAPAAYDPNLYNCMDVDSDGEPIDCS